MNDPAPRPLLGHCGPRIIALITSGDPSVRGRTRDRVWGVIQPQPLLYPTGKRDSAYLYGRFSSPYLRFPLHRNKSVGHHLEQVGNPVEVDLLTRKYADSTPFRETLSNNPDAYNVYKQDIGIGYTVSGSCTTSHLGGGYYNVYNRGSGTCYIRYGDCSASASSVSGSTNIGGYWIRDVVNAGSAITYITYCEESTSSVPSNGKELINNVHNAGSAKIYIKYSCGINPNFGRKLINDITNAGSSEIYITYRNCCPTFSGVPSPTNNCGKLLHNIRSYGSGFIDIKYWDCGASPSSVPRSTRNTNNCGKLVHDITNAGSGFIGITYWNCFELPSSVPSNAYIGEKLVDNVQNMGSGKVDIKYGECSASASSVPRNTFIGAKLDKKLANVMPQGALHLSLANEGPRRLAFKHARDGNNEKKESAADAAEADPSCQ
ncbi:hypothetical protein AVEN_244873-1 [Araneus ventricosus]|uniref:Uncharacterized protein n=1 Tax=Araneus ventricosus TaxID=182803 RepID=A0A4Y2L153_ARAVE|nr:hypothetical protein AVEN_244873-1 [Araneus ventricosus]